MKSFTNRHLLIVAVLLLASISANVTLQLRVGQLQRQLATLTQTQYGMTRTEGDEAPPIEAKTLSGGKAVIDPRSSPRQTVIYVFAPECPWCARNLPNVAALAAASKGHFRLVGIALRADGVQAYVATNMPGIEVYVEPSWKSQLAYTLGTTPMTIVTSPEGRIEAVWRGAYGPSIVDQANKRLGVSLPGMTAPDSPQVAAR